MSNIKITEVPDPVKADGKFDPTKPVQTRDGRKARIVCTDAARPKFPIVALLTCRDSVTEFPYTYTSCGKFFSGSSESDADLVNMLEQRVVDFWLNLYPDGALERHGNEAEAVYYRGPGAVTVHVQKTFNV